MALAGELTPPTEGRVPSCDRAGWKQKTKTNNTASRRGFMTAPEVGSSIPLRRPIMHAKIVARLRLGCDRVRHGLKDEVPRDLFVSRTREGELLITETGWRHPNARS